MRHMGPTGLMDPEVYRSEAFYEAELRSVFVDSWMFVAHERWLPARGDFYSETIGTEPVLVVRGADGRLRAFANACTHRASLLAEGQGNCGRRLTCPYHGWTFELDGRLVGIPRRNLFATEVDPSKLGLTELRLDTWEGLVFVNISGDAPALLDYLEDVPELLGGHDIAAMGLGAYLDDPIAANWKLVMDNAICDYHLSIVHADSIAALVDLDGLKEQAGNTTAVARVPWKESERPAQDWPGLTGDALLGSLGCYVFPNLHVIGFPTGGATVMWWTPTSHTTTRARVLSLSHDPEADVRAGTELLSRVQREDFDVCERMQRGVQSAYYRPGPRHDAELRVTVFQRRLLEMVGSVLAPAETAGVGGAGR